MCLLMTLMVESVRGWSSRFPGAFKEEMVVDIRFLTKQIGQLLSANCSLAAIAARREGFFVPDPIDDPLALSTEESNFPVS